MNRVIVALSGGKASAWCADWAIRTYGRESVVLYFNDTKWEHSDLYRFLRDVSAYLQHPITEDSDGRNPDQVFADEKFLGNNRTPLCSRILKADRLQSYFQEGDVLVFGIGADEAHRATRIIAAYQRAAAKRGVFCSLKFPLISEEVGKADVSAWLASTRIVEPEMYRLGFTHNNCSGGCVRAGKGQWALLLNKMPEVYAARERVEEEFRQRSGKDVHFLKGITLRLFRELIQSQGTLDFIDEPAEVDCIGVCDSLA